MHESDWLRAGAASKGFVIEYTPVLYIFYASKNMGEEGHFY
jgi:hypothetical protein